MIGFIDHDGPCGMHMRLAAGPFIGVKPGLLTRSIGVALK